MPDMQVPQERKEIVELMDHQAQEDLQDHQAQKDQKDQLDQWEILDQAPHKRLIQCTQNTPKAQEDQMKMNICLMILMLTMNLIITK